METSFLKVLVVQPAIGTTRRHRNLVLGQAVEELESLYAGYQLGILSTAFVDDVDFDKETPVLDYDELVHQVQRADLLYMTKGWEDDVICKEIEQVANDYRKKIVEQ